MRLKRQRLNSGCAAGADRAAKANPELLRPQATAERRSAWAGGGGRPPPGHPTPTHLSAAGADRAAKANPELLRPQATAERRSAWTGEGARPTRAHHTRAHYSLARSIAITSSGVITPVSWLCSSITGNVSRLYLSNSSANSFSFASSWQEMRGSWDKARRGVEEVDRTIFTRGTAPARVP